MNLRHARSTPTGVEEDSQVIWRNLAIFLAPRESQNPTRSSARPQRSDDLQSQGIAERFEVRSAIGISSGMFSG